MTNCYFVSNVPSFGVLISISQQIEVASANILSKSTYLDYITFNITWIKVFFKNYDTIISTLMLSVGIVWSTSI